MSKKDSWLIRNNDWGAKKETPRMYELFQYFLSIPIEKRTSALVAKHFGVSSRYVEQVRARNDWTERERDFEDSKSLQIQKSQIKAAEKSAFDWAKWDAENLEKTRQMSDQFFAKAIEILKLPLIQREFKENVVTDKDGNPVNGKDGKPIYQQVTILNPMKFTGSDARGFAEAAVLLSDYALNKSQGLMPKTINSFLPKPSKDMDDMNADELAEYADQLNRAAEQIVRGEAIDVTPLEQ